MDIGLVVNLYTVCVSHLGREVVGLESTIRGLYLKVDISPAEKWQRIITTEGHSCHTRSTELRWRFPRGFHLHTLGWRQTGEICSLSHTLPVCNPLTITQEGCPLQTTRLSGDKGQRLCYLLLLRKTSAPRTQALLATWDRLGML